MTAPLSQTPTTGFPWGDYQPREGQRDELFLPDGTLRPHVQRLGELIKRIGPTELARRWERTLRELRENGVTYNVYDDSGGTERPWQLDPVPLLLTQASWQVTAAALAQRARVIDALLRDLYGPQHLVREGVIPPSLLFENPGFLRACHRESNEVGESGADGRFLHLYGADLLRAPDGGFQVLGDRTQAPSGMGYALENRIVLSRGFPSVYRDSRVSRLAPFFRSLVDLIEALSPRKDDRAMAVLLTPGPYNETYFEHAYLASYLGLTLVEGADLTVRNRVVYLKTLGGLQRVDVVLRRLDDAYCDPLSLRSDSALGVAGLLSAAQAGNVAVINQLGTGVAETPAFLPYLPAVSQRLLGEPLLLPSVPTHWCGDPDSLRYVEENLEQLVLKPAYPRHGEPDATPGANLTGQARETFLARLRARPGRYVAQERAVLSTAPSWSSEAGAGVVPRPLALRAYAVSDGEGYRVMDGGLARVSRDVAFPRVSIQQGAGSKDTWVLSDSPVQPVSLLGTGRRPLALSRGGDELPSRVADNLFWVGRYVERVEGTARLLRELFAYLANERPASDMPELPALCQALAAHAQLKVPFEYGAGDEDPDRLEAEVLAFLLDESQSHTLLGSMVAAHRSAFTVRDRMSSDSWRVLGQLRQERRALVKAAPSSAADALDVLNGLVAMLAAFAGLQQESFQRSQSYRFIDMGRRIERAQNTARLLASATVNTHDDESAVLSALLHVLDNTITYRRRYHGVIQAAPVLDLLLIDEQNPRSVAFQLAALHEHVRHLPRAADRPFHTAEEKLVLRSLTHLRLVDVETLCLLDEAGKRPSLEAHLKDLTKVMPEVSDAITRAYLAHAVPHHYGARLMLESPIVEPILAAPGEGAAASTAPGEGAAASTAPGEGAAASTAPGEGAAASTAPGESAAASPASGEGAAASTAPGEPTSGQADVVGATSTTKAAIADSSQSQSQSPPQGEPS